MRDRYNRKIEYLRISLTDKCNLRCLYCMPESGVKLLSHNDILRYEQIEKIVKAMALLGIKKVRLTGGEPLVRKDVSNFIQKLKRIEGINEVALTTNGVLLEEKLDELCKAGLDAINLSLDTLDKNLFQKITRVNLFEKVEKALKKLLNTTNLKVKINCVPIKDLNENSLIEIAKLAKNYPIEVRFIELMPIGCAYDRNLRGIKEDELKNTIKKVFGELIPSCEKKGISGPARIFTIKGFKGKIGFIDAIDHKFCEKCNRVRLTADGFLKLCLNSKKGIDVKKLLADYEDIKDLAQALRKAIYCKPKEHYFFKDNQKNVETRKMFQIGG